MPCQDETHRQAGKHLADETGEKASATSRLAHAGNPHRRRSLPPNETAQREVGHGKRSRTSHVTADSGRQPLAWRPCPWLAVATPLRQTIPDGYRTRATGRGRFPVFRIKQQDLLPFWAGERVPMKLVHIFDSNVSALPLQGLQARRICNLFLPRPRL